MLSFMSTASQNSAIHRLTAAKVCRLDRRQSRKVWVTVMIRIAIPIFGSRVSPVFSACMRVLIIDIEADREIDRREIYLQGLSIPERVSILKNVGVETLICCGIQEMTCNLLKNLKIRLISGIAGEVEEVLDAFLFNRLDNARFHMPGYKTDVQAT